MAASLALAMLVIVQHIFSPFKTVLSDSMAPQYETGDAVVLKEIDKSGIDVGDVIVFRDPEEKSQLVIHRVIAIDSSGPTPMYATKGDCNPVADNWMVSTGEVVGGVMVNLPSFGEFLNLADSPKGYTSFVLVPAFLALALVFFLAFAEKIHALLRDARYAISKRNSFNPKPTASYQ